MVRGETGAVSGVKLLQLHFPRGTPPLSSPLLSLQGEAALKAASGWNWFACWAQTFRTWIVNNYPFQSRAIHRKVVVCSLPLKLSENWVTNLSIVDLLCLLRFRHRKSSTKCQSNQSFIQRSIRSETFPECDFLSGPVCDCRAWQPGCMNGVFYHSSLNGGKSL